MSKDKTVNAGNNQPGDRNGPPRRLPCRGCLPDCKDFINCDGRPWRTLATDIVREEA